MSGLVNQLMLDEPDLDNFGPILDNLNKDVLSRIFMCFVKNLENL